MNKLSKLLNVVIYLCIISYALPTGVMKGIPIQKILVCLLIILGGICLVLQRKSLEIIKSAKLEINLGVLGLLACIVSYILGNEWSIKFTGLFYISVIVFVELYFLVRYELAEPEKIVECILYMMLLKILGKIIIEIVFVCKLIEYEAVIEFYLNMFGTEASTMTMHLGRLLLIRVQTSSDIIVVTLMPFYWMMEKYKKSIRILLFALSGIYTLIVFSRVLMVEFCCFAFVAVLYYWKKIPKKVRCIGVILVLASSVLWLKPVIQMIEFRFFSSFAIESDDVRQIQMRELINGVKESPVFGHGFGSYISDYTRSGSIPFSYEIEYLSFCYQMGISGFVVFVGGVLLIYIRKIVKYARKNTWVIKVFTLIGLGWFVIRPAFNPAFLGLQNGFQMIGLLMINMYFNKKQEPYQK